MSSLISFTFILLLCFTTHGCKARHLGVANKGFASLFHYHHHHKVQVKVEMDAVGGKTKGCDKAHEGVATSATNEEVKKYRNGGGEFSGAFPINKPLVSWSVPSKNQDNNNNGKHHPGLFSDYSRPRTRPPSHN